MLSAILVVRRAEVLLSLYKCITLTHWLKLRYVANYNILLIDICRSCIEVSFRVKTVALRL